MKRLENGSWPHPARLPLGSGWSGHCTAPGHEGELPSPDVLESFCNLGYAGSCGWAPRERECDAVRFAVAVPPKTDKPGKPTSALAKAQHTIRIRFVCERNHQPVAHGDLEFDLEKSTWLRRHDDSRLQKMAECFLESYLNKKS